MAQTVLFCSCKMLSNPNSRTEIQDIRKKSGHENIYTQENLHNRKLGVTRKFILHCLVIRDLLQNTEIRGR